MLKKKIEDDYINFWTMDMWLRNDKNYIGIKSR